jgi:hypothetical protein
VASEKLDEKNSHDDDKGNNTKRKNTNPVTKKFSPKFHKILLLNKCFSVVNFIRLLSKFWDGKGSGKKRKADSGQ